MNEAETRAELIDPALKEAGWGVVDGSRIRREVIAPGRLQRHRPDGVEHNPGTQGRLGESHSSSPQEGVA